MNHRTIDGAVRAAITLAAVVCVSSSMLAQRKPRLVAGCPSTPAAFHSCAVEKAKAFTPPRTSDGQPSLQGIYETPMGGALSGPNSIVVDPAGGMIPYQPWAKAQKAENVEHYIDPYTHCLPITAPRIMLSPRTRQIQQYAGYVTIINESGGHPFRVVYLDGRPHLPADIKLWRGDSRGRWEGNTLVIETTNFNGKATVPGNNVLASTELKIVERITRVEPDLLRYEATITDPKTYTRPYTIAIPYTSPEGYQVLPYECHEGNLAVLQGLGGERAEDKAVEEDARRGIVRPRRPIQGGLTVGGQPIPEGGPR
jgi:hypothetical protein